MALWSKVQGLQGDAMRQLQSTYGVHFPIEVRHFFAQWLETQVWQEIDEDNLEHEKFALRLRDELIALVEEKANAMNCEGDFLTKLKLQETVQQFRVMYGTQPMNLVKVIKKCLSTEQRLLQQAENAADACHMADTRQQIQEQLEFLYNCTQETKNDLTHMQQCQESFVIQYQESHKIQAEIEYRESQGNVPGRAENIQNLQKQKDEINRQLSTKAQQLREQRINLAEKHRKTFEALAQLQSHILDEQLISWKRQQQLAGNGAPFDASLDVLQQWCESLAEIIWQNNQQIKQVTTLRNQLPIQMQTDILPMLNTTIANLLSSLVTSTFIIEKQPPQVLKKDARFTSTVRLLVGGKLNVHMNPPQVHVKIISEEQARALLKNDKSVEGENSGLILNSSGAMEFNQANGHLSVTFRNMALKKIKRAKKKKVPTATLR